MSVSGQLLWRMVAAVAVGIASTLVVIHLAANPVLAATLGLAAGILSGAILTSRWWRRVGSTIRAMQTGIGALQDGEFAISIRETGNDEFSELVRAHNRLGGVLRAQRQHLQERELLLDTVVAQSPLAIVLFDQGGHIIMGNLEARQLLGDGKRLDGLSRTRVTEALPDELRRAFESQRDGLVRLELDGREETLHVSHRDFTLNARPHHLVLIKRLTREISRQEIATWKKVIRVISHELNNSLGPIKSLAASGLAEARADNDPLYERIMSTISERAEHLQGFLENYARVARLAAPRPIAVDLAPLLRCLSTSWPCRVEAFEGAAWLDPVMIEQALINLLKNAHESGSDPDGITLVASRGNRRISISVLDRGHGMNTQVLSQAMLPFYSTKRNGSGVGLALVREIVDAHGGHLELRNRTSGGLEVIMTLPDRDGRDTVATALPQGD